MRHAGALGFVVAVACGGGEVAPVPVHVEPAAPRVLDRDLVCVADGEVPAGATVAWTEDGAPLAGRDGALPGDTVPADALRAGRTYRCALRVDEQEAGAAEATVRVPSVLLLLADDLGIGNVGVYGAEAPVTPRLDALAAEGVRFDAGYATAPECSPSRAGLLTGRVGPRYGFEYNLNRIPEATRRGDGLPVTERTLPDVLADAGWETTLVGKWHLGFVDRNDPTAGGFQHWFGFLAGMRWNMKPGQEGVLDLWPWDAAPPKWPYDFEAQAMRIDGRALPVDPTKHLTDILADAAIERLGKATDAPLFLEVAFSAAHDPFQATEAHLALLPTLPADRDLMVYEATVAALDAAVGRILDALAASGRADDTLVVFASDNGCNDLFGLCSNGVLRDGKARLTEGGLRVPFLVRWPDRLPAGVAVDAPVTLADLVPTVAHAAGVDLPTDRAYDGVDLLPFLRGATDTPPHERLFWRTAPHRVVREGRWKLAEIEARTLLFDLEADPGETTDLAAAHPDVVARLHAALEAREADYVAPAWDPDHAPADYYGVEMDVPF